MSSDIRGFHRIGGSTTLWHNLGATQRPDGSWALQVDTELVLDSGEISIANIKVGATGQSSATLRYLKTLDDGTVVVSTIGGNPLEGYKAARSQDAGAYPHYFGLTTDDEDWVIIEETRVTNTSTFKYFAGAGSFTVNWTGRAGLAYDEFYNIF